MRPLIWFRTDLRVHDNPALHHAIRDADDGAVAVFCMTQAQWKAHDMAPVRAEFMLRTLQCLSADLAERNIALRVVDAPQFSDVPAALEQLAAECKCDALYFNREYEINERRRDEAVTSLFGDSRVQSFTDQCLFEPGDLRTGSGHYYKVFTPFKKSWYREIERRPERLEPLDAPTRQSSMIGQPDAIPECIEGFDQSGIDPALWPGGEAEAASRLETFLRDSLETYAETRDFPGTEGGTSRLSPYLAIGAVSLRQCAHAVAATTAETTFDACSRSARTWVDELIWREFYKHILVGFPGVCMHRAFQRDTDQLVWNDNDEHFAAWCAGKTGVPIVDAAMRQLVTTGWMHNRLRMIVAMFLAKNLFLDWRRGEQFFMQHLVDGDLAANNGGWQWAASTGTDAAPYFRIFNPYSQSKKFDPDGSFIRSFVTELQDVDAPSVHDPSTIPALLRTQLDYPDPIVDCGETRAKAIEAFKALRES